MNLPNKLTIFRLILVPIMVIVPLLGISGEVFNIPIENLVIIGIFALASFTDLLDGKIARKYNLITTFGKFADPLADKILVLSAMLMLVEKSKLPAWIPIIVLAREFIVSGYRLIAVEKGGKVIAANIWGKIKTVTQMIGIIFMFLDRFPYARFVFSTINEQKTIGSSILTYMTTGQYIFNIITTVLITISVIATVFSGWKYLKEGKDLLKD